MAIDLDAIDALATDITPEDLARADAEAAARRAEATTRLAKHARTSTYTPPARQATPRMVGYVMVLLRKLADHNAPLEATERAAWMAEAIVEDGRVVATNIPGDDVSAMIDRLKAALDAPAVAAPVVDTPAPANPKSAFHATLDTIPEGRYALPVLNDDGTPDGDKHRYFKVKISKRGRKYLVEGHGGGTADLAWGGLVPFEHGALSIAQRIAEDWAASMVLFGHKTSHCGDCGRSLTNDASRAVGIGPYCRGKAVWLGTPFYNGDVAMDEDGITPVDIDTEGDHSEVPGRVAKGGRIDHTNCDHPRTPAGRAACRSSRK